MTYCQAKSLDDFEVTRKGHIIMPQCYILPLVSSSMTLCQANQKTDKLEITGKKCIVMAQYYVAPLVSFSMTL
jgi:hypothetical protein